MKKIYPLLFLLALAQIKLVAFNTLSEGQPFPSLRSGSNFSGNYNGNNSPTHSFDVLDYQLELDIYNCFISPYPRSYSGNVLITLRADSLISTIILNAGSNSLSIDSVKMNTTSFIHQNNILQIQLDKTYQPAETAYVKIYFNHLNVSDNSFFVSNGMVFTNTAPEGARNWFPCYDRPMDKATFSLKAKTPANVKLGSNGRLADSVMIGDTIWYNWISRDPVATYLIVISAKVNFQLNIDNLVDPVSGDTIPSRYYWNIGESSSNLNHIRNIMPEMLAQFSNLFGKYPFEKNGFATLNSQFIFAGMENQTLISLCPDCWDEDLIAHEFSHMWFGDLITCGTWADVWLNESFATYCDALWSEHSVSYTRYKQKINQNASSYFQGNPGFPLYNPSWINNTPPIGTLYNYAIIYAKGSAVLHMLRYVLGDTVFFSALKSYAADESFKYKNIVTSDFINKINSSTGTDLNWFFNQWVYNPNHPVYANVYNFQQISSAEWNVIFKAKQIQTNAPFFQMPLELKIVFSDGSDTLIKVFNEVNEQTFILSFNKQPASLQFDPNNNIVLKKGNTILDVEFDNGNIIKGYRLNQNYPNPFNPFTRISFVIPEECKVTLSLADPAGQIISTLINETKAAGSYEYFLNARELSSGVYFFNLRTESSNGKNEFYSTKKMILLK
ncbi:MAG: hypothetical protein HXY49_02900 [Ignavibacteriaceae bacterium]|nr:hypothetical protein [Ignavibacteriaceae bacterium]